MSKRKISFEQNEALARGRDIARANQRRRTAANEAARKADAERERERERREADELALRLGFQLGEHVSGLDYVWRKPRAGVVIEGPRSERGNAIYVRDDEGNEWALARYSVERQNPPNEGC
jgi:hypothetical protein